MRLVSRVRFDWLARAVVVMALASVGCEDKAIGRPCDLRVDAGISKPTVNAQALECPERICVQPAVSVEKTMAPDTTALCSATCSKNSDCNDGEKRGTDTGDLRCNDGFVCGVITEVGDFCCKKVCLCKDFVYVPDGGLQTPPSCDPSQPVNVNTCKNLPGRT